MKEAVKVAKTRRQPECPEEAAFLELVRTTDLLSRGLVRVLKTEDLSSTQYNVLRILRGAPEGLTCGEIANRMITRDPDVTRLLDRLEKRDLISRNREEKDRRTVLAHDPRGLTPIVRLFIQDGGSRIQCYLCGHWSATLGTVAKSSFCFCRAACLS